MAADDRSTGSTPPTPAGGWLVLALAAVTAYVAWQIAPLSARMDALERDRLATEDRLLGEIEKIANRVALLQPANRDSSPNEETSQAPPTPVPTSAPLALAEPPAAARASSAAAPASQSFEFLDHHVLPADAEIVRLMLVRVPPAEIGRQTNHSKAFVLARGVQIERMLASAPGAPPDLTKALRQYLRDNGGMP